MSARLDEPCELALEAFCPVRARVLPHIRRLICGVAEEMGFSEEEISQIEISVDEACANVINHAYAASPPAAKDNGLHVRLMQDAGRLTIHIKDKGVGMGGARPAGVASVEEYMQRDKPHGLGTYIMNRFMDEVEYTSGEGCGTEVRLTKALRQRAGEVAPR